MSDDLEYARLQREKEEREKLPIKDDTQEYLRLEVEKKQRAAISGYGVPRADFSHAPAISKKEIPADVPSIIKNWLQEKTDE